MISLRPIIHIFQAMVTSVAFYSVMVLWTLCGILLFPIGYPIWRLTKGWSPGRVMRSFVWIYGRVWILLTFPFFRIRPIRAAAPIPQPSILVVNHLSFLDTYCMGALPFSDVVFAIGAWPFKMFWYAPFMRLAQYMNVEAMGWEGCLQHCSRLFLQGASVVFFPEGHRSATGKLQRFYSGPFKLAVQTGVPIVPLCITGTDTVLPPSRWYVLPAKVRVEALPAIDPAAFSGPLAHIELRNYVKFQMSSYLATKTRTKAVSAHHESSARAAAGGAV